MDERNEKSVDLIKQARAIELAVLSRIGNSIEGSKALNKACSERIKYESGILQRALEDLEANPDLNDRLRKEIRAMRAQVRQAHRLYWEAAFVHDDFARGYVKKLKRFPGEISDKLQVIRLAIFEAARHFDLNKGVQFLTAAVWYIEGKSRRDLPTMDLSSSDRELADRLALEERDIEQQGGDPGEWSTEIADRMGISMERLESLRRRIRAQDYASFDGRDEDNQALVERIPAATDEDLPLVRLDAQRACKALEHLPMRERQILEFRYGISGDSTGQSYSKTGALMGLSRSRITQLEDEALQKLKVVIETSTPTRYSKTSPTTAQTGVAFTRRGRTSPIQVHPKGEPPSADVVLMGSHRVDLASGSVDGKVLSPDAAAVLRVLGANKGQFTSTAELYRPLQKTVSVKPSRAVQQAISRLRSALDDDDRGRRGASWVEQRPIEGYGSRSSMAYRLRLTNDD